ncbi:hypothetical protein HER10_EVM0003002 [Colletotrichum scovillei]|uniref:uncharacterized protein n=1 Tax=Colletotrichum scovillei TaxID=1209932 RepID=UPI0015C2F9B0|nr:uncharacterized protein HER10_EVM0003002 [Colletotrichum scovillei]KAF4781761.1 hypothetical protein HER10_EVM0003002 [Colletotrichum scovillei]
MDHLFKTTDSVIEILWDVALAFFVVRIALSYFFFTFTATTLLSWIVCTYRQYLRLPLVFVQQQQYLTTSQSDPFVLAVMLLQIVVGVVVVRYVVAVYDVPRVAWFRLAIGGLAAAFLAGAEGYSIGCICVFARRRRARKGLLDLGEWKWMGDGRGNVWRVSWFPFFSVATSPGKAGAYPGPPGYGYICRLHLSDYHRTIFPIQPCIITHLF